MIISKSALQVFVISKRNNIQNLFLSYKGNLFEFDFEMDAATRISSIPANAKETSLDFDGATENLAWAIDCLKSGEAGIFELSDGSCHFGKPYKGEPISEEIERKLFPRHELVQDLKNKKKDPCDYFDKYEKKKR